MERTARIYDKARIGDIDIHYHLADFTDPWRNPPAETFLCYSGYCRSLEFWHAWVPLLARDYRVLRMDPRGYGFTDEFPVSRYFRGARCGSLGGGTTETLRNLVGKKLVEQMDLATGVAGMSTY